METLEAHNSGIIAGLLPWLNEATIASALLLVS
jgi:hypothetical protein